MLCWGTACAQTSQIDLFPCPSPSLSCSCLSIGKHWLGSQVDVTKQSAISKEHCLVPHKELLPILEPVGFTHSSQLYSLHLPGCELWPPTFWLRKTDWGSLWSLAVLFLSFTNRCGQFSLPGEGYAATPAGLGVKNQELKTYLGASLWHWATPELFCIFVMAGSTSSLLGMVHYLYITAICHFTLQEVIGSL